MMQYRTRVFALGILGGIVAVAAAQPPGTADRGPRNPGRGPLMPGMDSSASLLGIPEVQKELGLTDPQRQAIQPLLQEMPERMQRAFGEFNPRDLFPSDDSEREQRMAKIRRRVEKSVKQLDQQLAEQLKPEQNDRLRQLQLQRRGAAALLQSEIAETLKLSPEQIESLRKLAEPQGMFPFGPRGAGAATSNKLRAILNPKQRDQWSEITGEPFKFPVFPGPGGPMGQERKLVRQFDRNGDKQLDHSERQAARQQIRQDRESRGNRGFGPPGGGPPGGGRPSGLGLPFGFGPPGPRPNVPGGTPGPGGFGPPRGGWGREPRDPPKPGKPLAPDQVSAVEGKPLYDADVLRTLFLDFADADWEEELSDFYGSDVDVPADLTVDGRKYPLVGVHFRGASSYFTVAKGFKRSLNVSLDFHDDDQRIYGYKTLNLLNSHEDPTFLHTVLYFHIARHYLPAPQANFVRLAINGEDWGLFVNAQQFNSEFLAENFPSTQGSRWKVPGSPGGRGGLEYLGDDVDAYKDLYELKSKKSDPAWQALIRLCKTLNETPPENLVSALEPMLDIDEVLWFLALENALINSDGYWIRASDYGIFLDEKGKFHIIPHDANETFQIARGPGMWSGRGEEGGGIELDPLIGLDDPSKPLRSRLLAIPELRRQYLSHVRTIAEEWLDWSKLEPVVNRYVTLIEECVQQDTRKLSTPKEFRQAMDGPREDGQSGRRGALSLREFVNQRGEFLRNHPEIQKLGPPSGG